MYSRESDAFLDMQLETWNDYSSNALVLFAIRKRGVGKNLVAIKPSSSLIPEIVENIENPKETNSVEFRGESSSGKIGRSSSKPSSLIISNQYGTVEIVFDDKKFAEITDYLRLIYRNEFLIKDICRNVRMHVVNVLREVGMDPLPEGRFATTGFYDNRMDKKEGYQEHLRSVRNARVNSQRSFPSSNAESKVPVSESGSQEPPSYHGSDGVSRAGKTRTVTPIYPKNNQPGNTQPPERWRGKGAVVESQKSSQEDPGFGNGSGLGTVSPEKGENEDNFPGDISELPFPRRFFSDRGLKF